MSTSETKNLLLLDDDDIRMEPFIDFLEDVGFKVHHAQFPNKAWEFLGDESIEFHLIVLDLIIPTRGGYSRDVCPGPEICGEIFLKDLRDQTFKNKVIREDTHNNRLKIKKKYKDIPVVVFTARNFEHSDLVQKLKNKPFNAVQVDSKRLFDFEEYARNLMDLVK